MSGMTLDQLRSAYQSAIGSYNTAAEETARLGNQYQNQADKLRLRGRYAATPMQFHAGIQSSQPMTSGQLYGGLLAPSKGA
ncbi:hypothetical protein [Vibrio galatheae]|nr:hypothetical protein [Vibrio galatheae]